MPLPSRNSVHQVAEMMKDAKRIINVMGLLVSSTKHLHELMWLPGPSPSIKKKLSRLR